MGEKGYFLEKNIRKIIGIIIGLWLLNWIVVGSVYCMEEGGQFGDRFGATTSLFSGITIALLVYTITLTQKQIDLQRQELIDGKAEFKKQNETLKYQKFDNTFFNLVNLHDRIKNDLEKRGTTFSIYANFVEGMRNINNLQDLKEHYESVVYSHTLIKFGQYIRNFELTVNFILDEKEKRKHKEKFLRIYFAQLSTEERNLFLYHYNLSGLPKFWDKVKDLLFVDMQENHLSYPPHAFILDGVPNSLREFLKKKIV